MTHFSFRQADEVGVRIVHAVARAESDREGQVALLDRTEPRVVGVLQNTPWPVAGQNPVEVMLETARTARVGDEDPCAVLEALFAELDRAMTQLASAPLTDESFDSMWDFGGHAALVAVTRDRVAVGRVGDLRVSRLVDGNLTTVLSENSLAAELLAAGRQVSGMPANVITDCLGTGAERRGSRVVPVEVDREARLVLISGTGAARAGDLRALQVATGNPMNASSALASAVRQASGYTALAAIVDVVRAGAARRPTGG